MADRTKQIDLQGVNQNSQKKLNLYEVSDFTVFLAVQFMTVARYMFDISLCEMMYEVLKFIDDIPVVGCCFIFNRLGFMVGREVYRYCDEVETIKAPFKQPPKNTKDAESLMSKAEKCIPFIGLKSKQQELTSIISENNTKITELEEHVGFLKDGIDIMLEDKKTSKEQEIMNLNTMKDQNTEVYKNEKQIKGKNEVLKNLNQDLENYKFFFVQMYLTGVSNSQDNQEAFVNNGQSSKPAKDILNELQEYRSKLRDQKKKIDQVDQRNSSFLKTPKTPQVISDRIEENDTATSNDEFSKIPSNRDIEDFSKLLSELTKLGSDQIQQIRDNLSNSDVCNDEMSVYSESSVQGGKDNVKTLARFLNKYSKTSKSPISNKFTESNDYAIERFEKTLKQSGFTNNLYPENCEESLINSTAVGDSMPNLNSLQKQEEEIFKKITKSRLAESVILSNVDFYKDSTRKQEVSCNDFDQKK